jgi:heme exporter protein A
MPLVSRKRTPYKWPYIPPGAGRKRRGAQRAHGCPLKITPGSSAAPNKSADVKLLAENVTIERGGRAVLSGVDFAVQGGEALILTGANGAGKTTLLRAVAGLLAPVDGRITLQGGDPEASVGEQCHLTGHANAVKQSLTVAENAAFWGHVLAQRNGPPSSRVEAILNGFGLAALADIPARFLSAGQSRRLGLCRLLLAHRPIWLLDEPTVSLDAASAAMLAVEIDGHVSRGGIVIAATHLPLGLKASREFRLKPAAAGEVS